MYFATLVLTSLVWCVLGDTSFGGASSYSGAGGHSNGIGNGNGGNGNGNGGNGNGNGGYNYDTPQGPGLGFQGQQRGSGGGGGGVGFQGTQQQQQDPIASLAANIPGGGVPGEDYPILASIPDTGFSCQDQQDSPGYFADTADEARCQVFHICQFDGRQDSFLCPNGTIFNQQYFVCDWWYNVDCDATDQFLALNSEIGKVQEGGNNGNGGLGASGNSQQQQRRGGAPSQQYGPPQQNGGNGGGNGPSSSLQVPSGLYGAPSRY
ncbi:hypothetical protein Pcinc_036678 [Petrolisthes cinctipes]|uniref:Chitin-binding type-2 domain-containing protein n=1 Tax=Petrolisthes cinctipes TaxID=88211 RepID=A0AAE1BVN5_PETCI|nr:hypothetical protein Pcinc_036678 [Petrolisthes cinctipes]